MKNWYEILNVDINATKEEIKDNYFKLVRKYPPEKEGEKFSEIRKAYEILMDDDKRASCDIEIRSEQERLEKEIKELEDEAEVYVKLRNYKKAIRNYKKILMLDNDSENIRNKMGVAFLENNDLKEAKLLFEELIKENDCSEYNYNLARVLIKSKDYSAAELYLLKARETDDNLNILFELIDLRINMKKYEEAEPLVISVLEEGVYTDYYSKLMIFRVSLKLIKYYLDNMNEEKINGILNSNFRELLSGLKIESNIINSLTKLVYKLCYLNMRTAAKSISEYLNSIGYDKLKGIIFNGESNIEGIQSDFLKKDFLQFVDDDRILEELKEPIYYLFIEFEGSIFIDKKHKNIEDIKYCINHKSNEVLGSIYILKNEYNRLYKLLENMYSRLESMANKDSDKKMNINLINDNRQTEDENCKDIQDREKSDESIEKLKKGINKAGIGLGRALGKGIKKFKSSNIYSEITSSEIYNEITSSNAYNEITSSNTYNEIKNKSKDIYNEIKNKLEQSESSDTKE